MKKEDKKPDLVVFNEEEQKYNASLKPYATSANSPVIQPLHTAGWKNDGIQRVNKQLKSKFEEVKREYEDLIEKFQYNDLVYNAKFSFEPNIGETYYLYKNKNSENFLSIIAPEQCNFKFIGAFRLNSEKMWEKISGDVTL